MYLDGDYLEVVVERKKIKNIYFRINEENQIYVTCPKLVSKFEIDRILKSNKDAFNKPFFFSFDFDMILTNFSIRLENY